MLNRVNMLSTHTRTEHKPKAYIQEKKDSPPTATQNPPCHFPFVVKMDLPRMDFVFRYYIPGEWIRTHALSGIYAFGAK